MSERSEMEIRWLGIAIGAKAGGFRVVTTVEGMARILTEQWPEAKESGAWRGAVEACLKALETGENAEAARAAFIMAAEDAGIAVDGNHERFEPPPKREKPKKR